MSARVVRVAVPSPLARHFDYLLPAGLPGPAPGARVRVSFGRREVVGVVLGVAAGSEVPREKLKPIRQVLDAEPLFPATLLELLGWAAGYYHHPIGEVLHAGLPVLLRRGEPPVVATVTRYALTVSGQALPVDSLKRSPRQQQLYRLLQEHPEGMTAAALAERFANWREPLRRLQARDQR